MQSMQDVNFNFPFVKPVQDGSDGNNNDLLSALQYVQLSFILKVNLFFR